MRRIISLGTAIAVLLLMAISNSGMARAQYPTPSGNLTVAASQTTATAGQSVTVTATLLDVNGTRLASHSCTLNILSQPGTDASVTPANANTDASGVVTATVNVGTTPGTITVRVTCGSVIGSVSVVAGASVRPSLPPRSAVELPNTGSGASGQSHGSDITGVLAAALVLLVLGGHAVRSRRRRA